MPKIYFSLLFMVFTVCALGQSADGLVRIYGKVLSQKDSSAISAALHYEKLPYYDDMGMAHSGPDGSYEFYLVENNEYTFKLSEEGFMELEQELKAIGGGEGSMQYDFYMEPESEPDLITLENLIFARGSDVITESSYEGLDELVKFLNDRPNVEIQLEGHTDFAGNADANMRLSQSRVDAVKEYLVSKGIKKTRVFTKAFGGTQPLYAERTDEAKAKNRRVEVRILKR